MGEYFVIVNQSKRQYIDPATFGDNPKASGYMHGNHPWAVAVLVCDPTQVNHSRYCQVYDSLAGSWCGDRIIAIGDEASGWVNIGIDTQGKFLPDLIHEEYEDISYAAIDMLCHDSDEEDTSDWIRTVVERTKGIDTEFVKLCTFITVSGSRLFEKSMVDTHGENWLEKFQTMR